MSSCSIAGCEGVDTRRAWSMAPSRRVMRASNISPSPPVSRRRTSTRSAGGSIRSAICAPSPGLLRLVFREAPDVVHTHTAKAGTLGRVAACLFNMTRPRRRRCVVVHTFHGHVLTGYFGPTMNVAVRLAERTLARITDRVVTISPAQRDDIVTRFNVAAAARTTVVPLGLDLERLARLDPSRRALARPVRHPRAGAGRGLRREVRRDQGSRDAGPRVCPRGGATAGRRAAPGRRRAAPCRDRRAGRRARAAEAGAPGRMDRRSRAACTRRSTSARCRR